MQRDGGISSEENRNCSGDVASSMKHMWYPCRKWHAAPREILASKPFSFLKYFHSNYTVFCIIHLDFIFTSSLTCHVRNFRSYLACFISSMCLWNSFIMISVTIFIVIYLNRSFGLCVSICVKINKVICDGKETNIYFWILLCSYRCGTHL